MSDRRQARRDFGADAILSEAEAVALLPCRDSIAREWLRKHGLVLVRPIGRVVIWGDVVAKVRAGEGPVEPEPTPAPPSRLPRSPIRRR